MKEETETRKTPEEAYEEAAFELAIYRLMQRNQQAVRADMRENEEVELTKAADDSLPRMMRDIDKQKPRTRQSLQKQCLQVLKVAAMVVLVLNMGVTAAVAMDSNVRAKVFELLVVDNGSYLDIRFVTAEKEMSIPETWKDNYYPTYIPDGYVLQYMSSYPEMSELEYADANGKMLDILFNGSNSATIINSENADISQISLHGVTATVLRQPNNEVDILWSIGNRYFVVFACDYETALDVAEGIRMIKKD